MPKAKQGVATSGIIRMLYREPAEMPWQDIEKNLGASFDAKDREEIHRCTVRYFAHLSIERSRVHIDDVKALRRKIVSASQALIDVANRFRSRRGPPPSDRDEDLFLAVAFSSQKQDFDLTTLLHRVVPACQDLVDGLSESAVADQTSRLEPESVALAHFLAEAIRGADHKPARRNPGYGEPRFHEYERWGVALGPSARKTAELAQAVLDRPVTTGQLKRAFKLAQKLASSDRDNI